MKTVEVDLTNPDFDPIPEDTKKETIGRIAICGIGKIGLIEGRAYCFGKWMWVGKKMTGQQWASANPRYLSLEDEKLIRPLFN